MLRALKIGKLFNIGIYIHWTFWLLPIFLLFNSQDAPYGPVFLLSLLAAIFGCVILHEFGHALTARGFGIGTRDITLYPIGGVARLEKMSEKPWEEFWIAVAGPAVNVVIAFLLIGVSVITASVGGLAAVTETPAGQFLLAVLAGNIILVGFNMLPAFPMDGGRVFRAILSNFVGQLKATRIAAMVSIPMAVLIGVGLSMFSGSIFPLIVAVFVFLASQMELRYVEWKHQKQAEKEQILELFPYLQSHFEQNGATRDEEPVETVPVGGFTFQPKKVADYVWDSRTGAWIKQPATE